MAVCLEASVVAAVRQQIFGDELVHDHVEIARVTIGAKVALG